MYIYTLHKLQLPSVRLGLSITRFCPDTIRADVSLSAVAVLGSSRFRLLDRNTMTSIAEGTLAGLSEMTFL